MSSEQWNQASHVLDYIMAQPREAESRARQQQALTESEISITVQGNQGKADYQRALQQAATIRALAEAEAEKAGGAVLASPRMSGRC